METVKEEKKNGAATEQPKVTTTAVALQEKNISDNILARVNQFSKAGAIKLPSDYSAGNALKFAWLMLQQTENSSKQPAIQVCTKESVANALLEMTIQGLNPMKKQCYFIVYGNKLNMQRSYMGSMAVAKRVAPVKSIHAQVIYKKDEFAYAIDQETGRKTVTKHVQNMENIDLNEIKGAYAIVVFNDGTRDMEVMNILQIKKAWAQGFGGGNTKAHQNFTDEMCKKTVINRVCKMVINSSDDSSLFNGGEEETTDTMDALEVSVAEEVKTNANVKEISMDTPAPVEEPAPAKEEGQPSPTEPVLDTLPEDDENAIILQLEECKNANQVKKVEQAWTDYADNTRFQLLIANAKAKFATGADKRTGPKF